MKYLVDVPKELFKIFSGKYGAGKGEERVIDDTTYRIQPLNIETNAWHGYKPWREEGKSVVTIGLFQDGVPESIVEVSRFMVWNHIPEVSGVEAFSLWAGVCGVNHTITEQLVPHLGNGLDPFNLVTPETPFIIEVMGVTHTLGKDIKARRYMYKENIGFIPEKEYHCV